MPRAMAIAVATGLWLVAPGARADDDVATCTTRSDRSPSEILAPTSAYVDRPLGVTIVEGETLCLTATVTKDGGVAAVSLDGPGEPAMVRLHLDPRGPSRALHVRTSLTRWLRFSYAVAAPAAEAGSVAAEDAPVDGRQEPSRMRFVRVSTASVPPRGLDLPLPDAGVHELLLDDFSTFAIHRRGMPPPFSLARRRVDGEVTVLPGVRLFRSLRGFDDALRAGGYGPFPQALPSMQVVLGIAIERWRFRLNWTDAWMAAASRTGDASVRANLFELGVDAGYDFLRWRGLTGFALVGLAGSTFTMDAVGPNWNYLGGRTASLGNPTTIQRDMGFLALQAGFEEIAPLGAPESSSMGLLVSIQGGYSQEFALSNWFSSGTGSVGDGRDVNFGGPWLRVGLGIVGFEAH